MDITNEFISQSVNRFKLNLPRIEKCLDELSEEEIWKKPNGSSNSAGNLILHLCGNITQYIISSLGHSPDNRKRDEEFAAKGGYTKEELRDKISSVVNKSADIIENSNEEELLRKRKVQVYDVSGVDIIVHVIEHFSYHTGQIVFWTKMLKDKDMEFYKGVKL